MRVGVYLSEYLPAAGGKHTYEHEVFRCLVKLAAESKHKFVLWGFNDEPPKGLWSPSMEYVSLRFPSGQTLNSKPGRGLIRFAQKVHRRLTKWRDGKRYERLIRESGIEFVWNVGNVTSLTMDLPYITVVFDLQHRLQCYFPEVSMAGEWRKREERLGILLRRASAIITGTEAGKAEIEHFYQVPAERIRVLPHPTPQFALEATEGDSQHVLAKYNLPRGYLFYPAQFWPHKNHACLLHALRCLRDNHGLTLPMVFIGSDKGNQRYIRQLVEEFDLSSQVHFLGFVPQADLPLLYREALALTFLSFFGPDNLPPLEAFALGCPVIAAEVSGAREQLGEAALLVDPKDANQVALAVKSIHDNASLRQSLIQRGRAQIAGRTGENYVRGVFSILDEFEPIRRCWSNHEPFRLLH
jgi:glycosyltransferase involved in cell wall biosynthesis